MNTIVIEPLASRLAQTENPDDHWLWCEECRRFFHHRDMEGDDRWPRCPFPDCYGYGYDFHLYFWDTFREPDDPRWPASAAELRHGMCSPEMASFYEARLRERIDGLVGRFECWSGVGRTRYLRPFLKLASDLCWDLTDPEDDCLFMEEAARDLLQDLPVWSQTADLTEASVMLEELRAFFAFAERTGAVPHAAEWGGVVADDAIAGMFVHTMRTDRRLRGQRHPRVCPPRARPKRARKRKRRR